MSNDTCYLVIKFVGDENNWIHPISLNGRVIEAMYVDGELYERVRVCHLIPTRGVRYRPHTPTLTCSECGAVYELAETTQREELHGFAFCQNCGAKVVTNGE